MLERVGHGQEEDIHRDDPASIGSAPRVFLLPTEVYIVAPDWLGQEVADGGITRHDARRHLRAVHPP
jgi:hypothetical protein